MAKGVVLVIAGDVIPNLFLIRKELFVSIKYKMPGYGAVMRIEIIYKAGFN